MADLNSVRERLEAARASVAETTSGHIKRYGALSRYVNVLATVSVAGATFMQFVATEKWLTSHIIGMSIASIALLLTTIQLFMNADVSKEIEAANKAITDAEAVERELREQTNSNEKFQEYQDETLKEHRNRLYVVNQALEALLWINEAIEQSLTKPSTGSEFMEHILVTAGPSIRRTFRFNNDQAYALNVYEADRSGSAVVLKLVGHVRSTSCDTKAATRWAPGEGVAGHCFNVNEFVEIPDSSDRSARTIVAPPKIPGHTMPSSFLAAPIRTGNLDVVWGVVVASCSDPHHFAEDSEEYSEARIGRVKPDSPAGRLQVLAGVLALAVQAHLAKNAPSAG